MDHIFFIHHVSMDKRVASSSWLFCFSDVSTGNRGPGASSSAIFLHQDSQIMLLLAWAYKNLFESLDLSYDFLTKP